MSAKRHHDVFFAHNGPGPWPCSFCSEPVHAWWHGVELTRRSTLAIHHKNEIKDDARPENLAAAHHGCHTKHHKTDNPIVPKGSSLSAEHRAAISAGLRQKYEAGWTGSRGWRKAG